MLSVSFRVDGGRRLGMGHVNRCLSIAKYLNGKGVKCFFLVSNPSIQQNVSPYGKVIRIRLSNEEHSVARFLSREKDCKVLVIDSKRNSIVKLLRHTKGKIKTVLIDNIKHCKNCDLVVLPGVKEQFVAHPENALVGSEYVLLNPSFQIRRHSRRNGSIFFSAGSTDKLNITNKVLSAFKKSDAKFQMTVVLGRFYKHVNKITKRLENDSRFEVLVDPPNFADLLSVHSLGIVTFGISVYEAAAAGLPILVLSHSKENDISAKKVEKYSWMKYVGKYDMVDYDELVNETLTVLEDKKLLHKMTESGRIVDGKGPRRVGDAIINLMKDSGPL